MKAKYMMEEQLIYILEVEGFPKATSDCTLFECKIENIGIELEEFKKRLIEDSYEWKEYNNWIEMALWHYGYDDCLSCFREEVCDYVDSFIN